MLTDPLRSHFLQRLSWQAEEELQKFQSMIQEVSLTDAADKRLCFLADNNQKLMAGMIYRTSMKSGSTFPAYHFVWKNIATPRVKFFGWLLTKNRINCKSNLLHKKVLDEDACDICGGGPETADHIVSGCPFAQAFWRRIGWRPEDIANVQCLWESQAPVAIPKMAHSSLILLLCRELWKHRHDVLFRRMPPRSPAPDRCVQGSSAAMEMPPSEK